MAYQPAVLTCVISQLTVLVPRHCTWH